MGKTLDSAQVHQRLTELHGWSFEANAITRKLTFADFRQAIAFIVRLAFEAEQADHHPDILISYKRVTLSYSTHSEGGVTEKDFAGATMATKLATEMGGR
jgi:4a-hydroxytetrahydrobiopterin dehydratase